MPEAYKSIIIETTLRKIPGDPDNLQLNIPFTSYGQNVIYQGKDVTYRLNSVGLGKNVLAKVDYRLTDMPGNSGVVGEANVAENFAGRLGTLWSEVKGNAKYSTHYSVTLAEKLATYDEEGNKTLYDGPDKDELAQFCEWDGAVEVEEEII